jgi:hypothetical protein
MLSFVKGTIRFNKYDLTPMKSEIIESDSYSLFSVGPAGFVLVDSRLFAIPILVLWVRLEKKVKN